MGIFAELTKRRFFQILASYAAVGWGILAVFDQLQQHDLVPEIIYRIALIWYIGGLPAAALIGWHHGEKGRQKAPRSEIAMLTVLLLLVLSGSAVAVSRHLEPDPAQAAADNALDLRRVAVLYFKDLTQGGEEQYLADGLTEDLIRELSQVRSLDVISQNGVAQYRGSDLSPDSIARALGAGTVVDGTVEKVGGKVRVSIRVMDGTSGAEFRRTGFEHSATDLFALRDDLTDKTSRFLREWIGDEVRVRKLEQETKSVDAWALVQRAAHAVKDAQGFVTRGDAAGVSRSFDLADSYLARAQAVDTAWAEPAVLRASVDYRRSRAAGNPDEAVSWIQRGLGEADRALRRAPNDARAHEVRGTLNYWHYLLGLTPDPAQQQKLLKDARADLETAVKLDPTLASAHSTLSHLYYRDDDLTSAVLEARRAYEEDAYLDVANEVLWRLFTGSYDLEEFTQAKRWCDEGTRRFPDDFRFANCQLMLMTTSASRPDPGRAWELLGRIEKLTPETRRANQVVLGRMIVGGVLAAAGQTDSARAVLRQAHDQLTPEIDPSQELLRVEAHMWDLAGDQDHAIELLRRQAAADPQFALDNHWWWRDLRTNPHARGIPTDE